MTAQTCIVCEVEVQGDRVVLCTEHASPGSGGRLTEGDLQRIVPVADVISAVQGAGDKDALDDIRRIRSRIMRALVDVPKPPARESLAALRASDRAVITVTEAASLLEVDERTVRRACVDGQIPSVRVGTRILIPRERFIAMLEGSE